VNFWVSRGRILEDDNEKRLDYHYALTHVDDNDGIEVEVEAPPHTNCFSFGRRVG